jgi:pSer/pThr/pTyr-binding forkhead associated (FHA) protein
VSTETVLVEILGQHGHVQLRERIVLRNGQRTFSIGRSMKADVTLDDDYVAAMHALVEITTDGTIRVRDLGTVNGVVVAGKRCHGSQDLEVADGLLQIGHTRLRVRTIHETLRPEKSDQLRPSSILRDPAWVAGVSALVSGVQLAYASWLGAPRDLTTVIVTALISGALAAGAWVAFWALLSRVMQGEWRWLRHAAIFLGIVAVFVALNGILEMGWFVFALPQWNTRTAWVGAVALGCALFLHLIYASNLTVRRAALMACIIPALSGGTGQWVQARHQMRDVNYIAASVRIYPPLLRLRATGTIESYFDSAATLRDAADKTRKAIRAEDEDDDASSID